MVLFLREILRTYVVFRQETKCCVQHLVVNKSNTYTHMYHNYVLICRHKHSHIEIHVSLQELELWAQIMTAEEQLPVCPLTICSSSISTFKRG
jgi:predicted metal-dependent HD superfamily phosphohydrolase